MLSKLRKNINKTNRTKRVRFKLKHNGDRPRLIFNKSNRYLVAQIIDDKEGKTITYAATNEKDFPVKGFSIKNKEAAKELGKRIAERAVEKGVKQVMLDRSGMIYHGKIAEFADSARKGGLEF